MNPTDTSSLPLRQPLRFTLPLGSRLALLLCIWLVCMIITSVAVYVLSRNGLTVPGIRVATVLQDVMMFILPAILTALLVTRRPAELLCIDYFPRRPLTYLLPILALIASIPAMNSLISWNEGISLPSSMAGIEEWMRTSEENAAQMIKLLTGGDTVGSLIMSILIVGIFAGVSEELLFRGSIQRLLTTGGLNHHAAIWITAFIFSAIHMQFFGFFPRLALGAFFGYLLYWTGSLWIPIIIHALNNTIVVVSMWYDKSHRVIGENGEEIIGNSPIESYGSDSPLLIILSLAAVALLIAAIRHQRIRE